MEKRDIKKELSKLYKVGKGKIVECDVAAMNFLMIDGYGNPNTSGDFGNAIEALYSVSYSIKFHLKKGLQAIDYGVMPLEALWWADDMNAFTLNKKDDWKWTAMIMQPAFVTSKMVDQMKKRVASKKELPALSLLRFQSFGEGACAQTLHIGPFSEEGPTIAKLHTFIKERGTLSGKHHEIYLSDIRRAAPENWITIIRQPFLPKEIN